VVADENWAERHAADGMRGYHSGLPRKIEVASKILGNRIRLSHALLFTRVKYFWVGGKADKV
jgi:hypothetical protein